MNDVRLAVHFVDASSYPPTNLPILGTFSKLAYFDTALGMHRFNISGCASANADNSKGANSARIGVTCKQHPIGVSSDVFSLSLDRESDFQ